MSNFIRVASSLSFPSSNMSLSSIQVIISWVRVQSRSSKVGGGWPIDSIPMGGWELSHDHVALLVHCQHYLLHHLLYLLDLHLLLPGVALWRARGMGASPPLCPSLGAGLWSGAVLRMAWSGLPSTIPSTVSKASLDRTLVLAWWSSCVPIVRLFLWNANLSWDCGWLQGMEIKVP